MTTWGVTVRVIDKEKYPDSEHIFYEEYTEILNESPERAGQLALIGVVMKVSPIEFTFGGGKARGFKSAPYYYEITDVREVHQ